MLLLGIPSAVSDTWLLLLSLPLLAALGPATASVLSKAGLVGSLLWLLLLLLTSTGSSRTLISSSTSSLDG